MIKTSATTKSFFCNPDVKQKKLLTAVLNKYKKVGVQPINIQEMFLSSSMLVHWYCCLLDMYGKKKATYAICSKEKAPQRSVACQLLFLLQRYCQKTTSVPRNSKGV